jgi:hypothetical protein
LEEIPERHVHALADGLDREINIAQPLKHGHLTNGSAKNFLPLFLIIGLAAALAKCADTAELARSL